MKTQTKIDKVPARIIKNIIAEDVTGQDVIDYINQNDLHSIQLIGWLRYDKPLGNNVVEEGHLDCGRSSEDYYGIKF